MHTIEQTPSKLIVRDCPGRAVYVVAFLLLTPWVLFCFYLMASAVDFSTRAIQIDCDRTALREAQCVVRRSRLLGFIRQPQKTQTYRRVTGAFFRARRGWNEEEAPTLDRWITLRTPVGELPVFEEFLLTDSLNVTRKMSAIATEIDHFLLSESSSLSLQHLPNWDGGNLAFAFGLYGLMLAMVVPIAYLEIGAVVVFDCESQHIQGMRQMILGKRTWHLTFERVRGVEICAVGEDSYAIALVMTEGRQRRFLDVSSRSSLEATCEAIREILRMS